MDQIFVYKHIKYKKCLLNIIKLCSDYSGYSTIHEILLKNLNIYINL